MPPYTVEIETTAYCSCGYCCNWEWGIRLPEKRLPFVAKYWTTRNLAGFPYYGLTSNGSIPAQARPPLFSKLSLIQYKNLPGRLLFPWRLLPRHGSIAADTDFYPFGTKMFVPGYGWGEVEDEEVRSKGKQE
ncbi:hypothetical protein R1flu_017961 [Riccia fluitans]|uniref:Uncharacterized protein n=1 Tax=Riccia fluitans TaxID=41844 RepID=A0ABD1ZEQ2_9MARC